MDIKALLELVSAQAMGGDILEVFQDGVIAKVDSGDYFVKIDGGKLGIEQMDEEVEMDELARWVRVDLRGLAPPERFPLLVPYSTMGYMGPLSGGAGFMLIQQDGSVQFRETAKI